ncbi:NADH:ubiquinone oxidoreductase subunit ASHI isoform X2 [Nomia melanderi]|uniref:NADH:ubiquinone oxidoreductase subunit ASHI isoform X2 n=1 Tax=Nomia melanderi TaxID=2448451 RepID=UPI001303FA7F|nr:uncharacterized protein LOC116425239 isoform X2 [Nomia melanderi]
MAASVKFGQLPTKLLKRNSIIIHINRCSSMFSKSTLELVETCYDELKPIGMRKWLPGLYPKTEEERIKAAEKYGLHPNEYKPEPNDHLTIGDYPQLPLISVEGKDPYYPWDMPDIRKNYHEPIHKQFDLLTEDRFAYGVPTAQNYYKSAVLCAVKQYPYDGKKHYTFEPA